ncbi:uncharacterized protein GIQ15_00418 [Arthroderma uncinatum]|uniref:uncharacterized protein n=1 Tax=Arthroderma uncinatum TaxID=74035 RepID=UPI00144A71C2|nr:uncharacterized protein GIQ15_00418 [Arthroderma uncinatum]KAF3490901.1 hypothetical protein GIQ15_00418 [Arthroderma uncinatum]
MNPYRYDRPLGAREQEGMNTIPFPPFPYDPADEMDRNSFTPPPLRLQGPPPQYLGAQGRLLGYPGEPAKYPTAARGKMDADTVTHTHTHHHSYMENNFRPQQPISYDAAPRHALIPPPPDLRGPPNPYISSSGHPGNFAAAAATPEGPPHSQERPRPFYRGVPSFGQHAQVPELTGPALARSRHTSQELQDTDHLPSSRPISLASLATITAKGKGPRAGTPQGVDLGDENPGDLDMFYNNHRTTGTRSNPRMLAGPSASLMAHQLQNVPRVDVRGHHGQAGELISQYHHHQSPQRALNSGQHMFSVDPGAPQYQNPNIAPPIPCQPPHINYAKHATVSAPATSAPTPAPPKTRPATPTGPYVMGPDDLSPTKQEEKFMAQKMMLERLEDNSINDTLEIDFSKLGVNQTDHYLDLIGAPPRPRPEVENTGNEEGRQNGMRTNIDEKQHGPKLTSPQGVVPGKSTMATRTSPAVTGHDMSSASDTRVSGTRRQEHKDVAAQTKTSQFLSAASHTQLIKSISRDADDDFDSPAWEVSNLRRAGLIPPISSGANDKKDSVSHPLETHQEVPPTDYTGPIFGRYIGGHVSMQPDFVYRPVPWSISTAEETKKAKEAEEASKPSSPRASKFPPPGLPPPPTLLESPIGKNRATIKSASDKKARINETLKWYRADRRWNEGLRERLGDIVQDYKECNGDINAATSASVSRDMAERTTGLLAQAIANLQSYLDGNAKDQAGNFANYGPVPDECCDSCKDGSFSLFDVQPGPFRGSETRN